MDLALFIIDGGEESFAIPIISLPLNEDIIRLLSDYVIHTILVPSSHIHWALWIKFSNSKHEYIAAPVDPTHSFYYLIPREACSALARKLKLMGIFTLINKEREAVYRCFGGTVQEDGICLLKWTSVVVYVFFTGNKRMKFGHFIVAAI